MAQLDTRCRAAGGRPGTAQYTSAQDLTGDGRADYLLSEGNYDCVGRPGLFRANGQARVDIFVTDAANNARRVYSDSLSAFRIIAGRPAKVQIARIGAICGPGATAQTQCAAQLEWNGQTFGQGVSVTSGAPAGAQAGAPSAAPAPAPAAATGTAGPLAVAAGAEATFLAQCRRDYIAREASAARWADDQCKSDWKKVVDSGPLADLILGIAPAQGQRLTLADIRSRATGVRWAARPEQGQLATGTLGRLTVSVTGAAQPAEVSTGWSAVGAEIPYDAAGALRVRGAGVTLLGCEKLGAGEGTRTYSVTAPGRAPFALRIDQRTAPTANASSFYAAALALDGRLPPRGSTSDCDF